MYKVFLLLFSILVFSAVYGQNVRHIGGNNESNYAEVIRFERIDTAYDLAEKRSIAILNGFCLNNKKSTLLVASQAYCVVKVAGIFVPGNAKNIDIATVTSLFFAADMVQKDQDLVWLKYA
jgi:hypothetical protein